MPRSESGPVRVRHPHPETRHAYLLRPYVIHEDCGRRMNGEAEQAMPRRFEARCRKISPRRSRGRPTDRRQCHPTHAATQICWAPPAGFEPAHPAPEAGALSPELRGPQGLESLSARAQWPVWTAATSGWAELDVACGRYDADVCHGTW